MTAKFSKFVGKHSASVLADRCIKQNAYVEITPLPGDNCLVSVHAGNEHLLRTRYNVLTLRGMEMRSGILHAVTSVEAAEGCRNVGERVCFAGTHEVLEEPGSGVEFVDADEARENGFMLTLLQQRPHGGSRYRLDELVKGEVVMTCEGSYSDVRGVIAQLHPAHWQRRYGLSGLIQLWKRFLQTQLDPQDECLADPFLFFPIGARVSDVAGLFEAAEPRFAEARKEMCGA